VDNLEEKGNEEVQRVSIDHMEYNVTVECWEIIVAQKTGWNKHQFGLEMPGPTFEGRLRSRAQLSYLYYLQHLIKISVVKGISSAVNEREFKYRITEEPISRILKSNIQETEVKLESDYSWSSAATFGLHGIVSIIYMYIFHFCSSNVLPGVKKVLHKADRRQKYKSSIRCATLTRAHTHLIASFPWTPARCADYPHV